MKKTLAEIARVLEGELVGDKSLVIKGLSGIVEAKEGDLTFVSNPKYIPLLAKTKASAVLASRDLKITGRSVIYTDNPSLSFAKVASMFAESFAHPFQGIHEKSCIASDATLGKNVSVGGCVTIEKEAAVGDNCVIYAGSYIGREVKIGRDCIIYPNVTIHEAVTIGERVIIHSGTVIGSDGFGYEKVNGRHIKIPQLGTVVIEDDVEIGANVSIDRARFDKTYIGRGTKIDNLVQIAHNVKIGEDCIIISQVGISGSVEIGRGAILAGQVGVAGHLIIGEGCVVAAQACVTKSIPPQTMVSGYPAKPHQEAKKINAYLQRLPQYVEIIRELKEKVALLEKKKNPIKKKSSQI
jgi:UDP-3-O-[3-hydroxymyristoyl] glucosamine N-acyltransferase